jgi:hypothetical protein
MTDKKIHSVDYIRAIKEYLKLRSITDDLTPQAQVHLQYLASLVRANGTAAVGYRELQRLRLSPKTISANFKRFRELGMIHKVDIGHANQFGKGGTVSTYHFNLAAILRLNSESADFPLGEASKSKVLTSQVGSADFPKASADFPKGVEPLPSRGSTPEELYPKQTPPEELCPEEASGKSGDGLFGVVSCSDSKSHDNQDQTQSEREPSIDSGHSKKLGEAGATGTDPNRLRKASDIKTLCINPINPINPKIIISATEPLQDPLAGSDRGRLIARAREADHVSYGDVCVCCRIRLAQPDRSFCRNCDSDCGGDCEWQDPILKVNQDGGDWRNSIITPFSPFNEKRLVEIAGHVIAGAVLKVLHAPTHANLDRVLQLLEHRIESVSKLKPTAGVIAALEDLHTLVLWITRHCEKVRAAGVTVLDNSPEMAEMGSCAQ